MTHVAFMAVGGALGAVVSSRIYRLGGSRRRVVLVGVTACALLGALMGIQDHLSEPVFAAGVGFLGTAAPLTALHKGDALPRGTTGVLSFASRRALDVAVLLVYGTVFAVLGFLAATLISGVPR